MIKVDVYGYMYGLAGYSDFFNYKLYLDNNILDGIPIGEEALGLESELNWGYSNIEVPINESFRFSVSGELRKVDDYTRIYSILLGPCYTKFYIGNSYVELTEENNYSAHINDISIEKYIIDDGSIRVLIGHYELVDVGNPTSPFPIEPSTEIDVDITIITDDQQQEGGRLISGIPNSLPLTNSSYTIPLGMLSEDESAGALYFNLDYLDDSTTASFSTFNSRILEIPSYSEALATRRSSGDLEGSIQEVIVPGYLDDKSYVVKDGWLGEDGYDGSTLPSGIFEVISYPNLDGLSNDEYDEADVVWRFQKVGSSANGDLQMKVYKYVDPGVPNPSRIWDLAEWDIFERITVTTLETDSGDGSALTTPVQTGWKWVSQSGDLTKNLYWKEYEELEPDGDLYEFIAYYDTSDSQNPVLISETKTKKEKFGGKGWLDTKQWEDPSGANRQTVWTYDDGTSDPDDLGLLRSVEYPDGSWEYIFMYDSSGSPLVRYLSWLDTSLDDADDNGTWKNCKLVYEAYSDANDPDLLYRRTEEIIDDQGQGTIVSVTERREGATSSEKVSRTYVDSTPHYLDTTTVGPSYMPDSITRPDGTMTLYERDHGYWDATNETYYPSTTDPQPSGTVDAFQKTVKQGMYDSVNEVYADVPNQSTWRRTVTVDSEVVLSEKLVYTGGSPTATVIETTTYATTEDSPSTGWRTETTTTNGRDVSVEEYDEDDNLRTYTDETGLVTTYTYDEDGDILTQTSAGVTTTYQYDPYGRVEGTTITGGTETLTTSTTYHPTGEVASQTDVNGLTTSYAYTNGGRTVTVTRPDGYTEVTDSYADGQTKSITGTGVVYRYYDYTVDTNTGFRTTEESIGEPVGHTDSRWTKRITDWAGRTVEVRKPAYSGADHITGYVYAVGTPGTGQLIKQTRTGMAPKVFEYNDLGQRSREGYDLDSPEDGLQEASDEPITEYVNDYVEDNGEWYQRNIVRRWLTDGSATSTDLTTTLRQLTGLESSPLEISVVSIDNAYTGETVVTTTVNTATATVTEKTDLPDTTLHVIRTMVEGRLVSETDPRIPSGEDNETTYTYDDLGRLETITDPTGLVTTQTYYPNTMQLKTVQAAGGPITEYTYRDQAELGAGQIDEQRNKSSDGTLISYLGYGYDDHGRFVGQQGSGDYDYTYGYDSTYGDRISLTTFRDQGGDETEWQYQASTGLLIRKEYADAKGTDYEYYDSGLLEKRTWARYTNTPGDIYTTYAYDSLGQLTDTDYSDGTHSIDWTYDRAGRITQIEDASGTRTLTYDKGQLASETYADPGELWDDMAIDKTIDAYGRVGGVSLTAGINILHEVEYYYHANTGRLETVDFEVDSIQHSTTYGYKPETNLVESVVQNRGAAEILAVQKSYDNLHRLTGLAYGQPHQQLGMNYSYNAASQREFATTGNGEYWKYTYDTVGQVESAVKRLPDHTVIPGYQFDYAYDQIGNRTSTERDGDSAREQLYYSSANATGTSGANELNQYGSRSVPRVLGVMGQANAAATVTANGESATRADDYFQILLDYSGETSPNDARNESILLTGTYAGQGAGGADAIAEVSTEAYLPPNPEDFNYDDDGNLEDDSRWTYTWNGENRLVAMEPIDAIALGLPNQKLVFAYDSQGRRFKKETYDWDPSANGGLGDWETTPVRTTVYLYDGWNLLSEENYDATLTLLSSKYYTWGTDLSGTLQGAGGVGGLLAVTTGEGTYYPAYDGNGNILAYLDSLTGATAAQFEYGPFGQTLRATGKAADELTLRFSTKYTDPETGLAYYGFRYYDPELGRWPSRDPIGEQGGLNLYAFVGNDGVNQWDYLGMTYRITLNFIIPATGKAADTGTIVAIKEYTKNLFGRFGIDSTLQTSVVDDIYHIDRYNIFGMKIHTSEIHYKNMPYSYSWNDALDFAINELSMPNTLILLPDSAVGTYTQTSSDLSNAIAPLSNHSDMQNLARAVVHEVLAHILPGRGAHPTSSDASWEQKFTITKGWDTLDEEYEYISLEVARFIHQRGGQPDKNYVRCPIKDTKETLGFMSDSDFEKLLKE